MSVKCVREECRVREECSVGSVREGCRVEVCFIYICYTLHIFGYHAVPRCCWGSARVVLG